METAISKVYPVCFVELPFVLCFSGLYNVLRCGFFYFNFGFSFPSIVLVI
jgi:hypothetical protein